MRRRLVALLLLLAVVGVTACSGSTTPEAGGPPDEPARNDVGVQLFQWTWDSIAAECTDVLGPAGVGWVLTSPPQEHIVGDPWWTSYQPVSYQVESRLGTREQFEAMVGACSEAGIDVVADAVVNHMTGQDEPGTGWAGSSFEHYSYPGLYTAEDFHHCGLTPNDDIVDYSNAEQVQTCELVNLADLDTANPEVQTTIRGYLEDLLDLGVAGFRIDAAKHMAAGDVAAIVEGLPEGTIVMQEVIGARSEPIQPADYADNGQVFDFYYASHLTGAVEGGSLEQVFQVDAASTGLTSDGAVVFVDNHDTERDGANLSFRDDEATSWPWCCCWRTPTAPRSSSPATPSGTSTATSVRRRTLTVPCSTPSAAPRSGRAPTWRTGSGSASTAGRPSSAWSSGATPRATRPSRTSRRRTAPSRCAGVTPTWLPTAGTRSWLSR